MSYLVLARKYRPQVFEDVIGQASVTRTLQNAIENKRLAHAQIFSGVRGVGKTTVARILAKALNCEHGPTPTPCNQCPKCVAITQGTAIDVQEVDGASNRGIDEIRALRENCKFTPAMCRYRVYIIDEVHMLTKEAFNALLKTLEEPPDFVYFVMATTEPNKIPATIHSRCQHHEFKRLHHTDIAKHLENILQKEGIVMEREAVTIIAKEADGSVRDSLSLLDQAIAYGVQTTNELCDALGIVKVTVLTRLLKAILCSDMAQALENLETAFLNGVELKILMQELASALRDILLMKELGVEKATPLLISGIGFSEDKELMGLCDGASSNFVLQLIDMLIKGIDGISKSSSPRLSSEVLLLRLCTLKELVPLKEILESIKIGKTDKTDKPKPQQPLQYPTKPESTSIKAYGAVKPDTQSPPIAVQQITEAFPAENRTSAFKPSEDDKKETKQGLNNKITNENWEEFCDFVKKHNPPVATYLMSCKNSSSVDEPYQLVLECNNKFIHEGLTTKNNAERLKKLTSEFTGCEINISIKLTESDNSNTKTEAQQAYSPKEQLLKQRLVQEALDIFDAKIVDVNIFKNNNK